MLKEVYGVNVETVTVGLSALTQVTPSKNVCGYKFKNTGSSLAIVSMGASAANGYSTGMFLAPTDGFIEILGPAQFYLAAGGATNVIKMITYLSAGFSAFP